MENYKPILKSQQRSRNEKHNVFTEEVNKIALSVNDDKKNTTNRLIRNIYIWNKLTPSMRKRRN